MPKLKSCSRRGVLAAGAAWMAAPLLPAFAGGMDLGVHEAVLKARAALQQQLCLRLWRHAPPPRGVPCRPACV